MDTLRLLLLLFTIIFVSGSCLTCIQCGNNEAWYSEEEHSRRIEACRHGLIQPSRCANHSHTHCIVSWYRTGGSAEKTVTERKCGVIDDDTGCTLYNSKISRKASLPGYFLPRAATIQQEIRHAIQNQVQVRHLLGNRDDTQSPTRKESASTFVEVCSQSCPFGECVNPSPTAATLGITALAVFASLIHL